MFLNVIPRMQREIAERQIERVKSRDERNYEHQDYYGATLKPFEIDLIQWRVIHCQGSWLKGMNNCNYYCVIAYVNRSNCSITCVWKYTRDVQVYPEKDILKSACSLWITKMMLKAKCWLKAFKDVQPSLWGLVKH